MSRLCDLFPQPKLLTLGGGRWLVSQYRLRDLAFLENWLASRKPGPFDDPALSSTDAAVRRFALRQAYDRGETPTPGFGSAEADEAYATPEGTGWLVWLSLHQCQPDMTHADAVEIAMKATAEQWAAFERIAWATDTLDEIDARIDAELRIRLPGGSHGETNFARAFVEVGRVMGMSLDAFGNLTLSQWKAIATGGKPKDRSIPIPNGWSMKRLDDEYLKHRAAFFREADPVTHPEARADPAAEV